MCQPNGVSASLSRADAGRVASLSPGAACGCSCHFRRHFRSSRGRDKIARLGDESREWKRRAESKQVAAAAADLHL